MDHVFSMFVLIFSMCVVNSFAVPPSKEACGVGELSNPNCAINKVAPESCPKPLIRGLMENKCQTATINLKAVGIRSAFPDAELDVGVTIRKCESGWAGTVDKCISLSEVDAATKAEITNKMKQVEKQWNSVTYTGHVCTKTPS